MVYCGKPSKGCSNCRERKIRDQKEPGCGQCEKRQRQCPGYRNIVDLMFRDESSHVIKKATKARPRRKSPHQPPALAPPPAALQPPPAVTITHDDPVPVAATENTIQTVSRVSRLPVEPTRPLSVSRARSLSNISNMSNNSHTSHLSRVSHGSLFLVTPSSPHWLSPNISDDGDSEQPDDDNLPSPEEGTWPQLPGTAALYRLSPTLEERGVAYFFSRYVAADDNVGYQTYHFVYDIWRPARSAVDRRGDSVMAAMTAVGLAGLASLTGSPDMLEWARQSYGTALCLTNRVLRIANEAVKDTTMLSVLILSNYEMLTGRTPQSVRALQQHIDGAAALAKMRGTRQFETESGAHMFMILLQIVLICCIQRDLPVPPAMVELAEFGSVTLDDPEWRVCAPIYKVLQVRHDIKSGLLVGTDRIVERLAAADYDFVRVVAGFPDEWQYQVVQVCKKNPDVFGDFCHVYPSLMHISTWNNLRSVRMLLHETIIGEFLKLLDSQPYETLSYSHRLQIARSTSILEDLQDALLATVPQHLGVVSTKDTTHLNDGQSMTVPIVRPRSPPSHVVPSPVSSSNAGSPEATGNDFDGLQAGPPPLNGFTARPTLFDLEQGSDGDTEESATLFLTLASTRNTGVWPLYLVGASSSCTPEIKDYVIGRLLSLYKETGLTQAWTVARMLYVKSVPEARNNLPFEDAFLFDLETERIPV